MPIATRSWHAASLVTLVGLSVVAGCMADDEIASESSDLKEMPALGPEPKGQPTRFPIVLAHGFDASPTNRWGYYRVPQELEADGHRIYVAIVPAYDAPEVRATFLAKVVDQALADGAEKVNIVAHSMGGLDARHVISGLGYGDVVASLSTISSPHHGSKVADKILAVLGGADSDDEIVDELASAWGLTFNELSGDSHVRAALFGISEENAPRFNQDNPDDPRVHYQSWAGVSSIGGIKNPRDRGACDDERLGDGKRADRMNVTLAPMAAIVGGIKLTPNDGMVPVEHAKWGDFRGCIPADHLDEVGQDKHDARDAWTGFDHVRFYRNVAYELAAMGF